MSKLNKKQIDSFAKSLMPELYKIQRRWNAWDKALSDIADKSVKLIDLEKASEANNPEAEECLSD